MGLEITFIKRLTGQESPLQILWINNGIGSKQSPLWPSFGFGPHRHPRNGWHLLRLGFHDGTCTNLLYPVNETRRRQLSWCRFPMPRLSSLGFTILSAFGVVPVTDKLAGRGDYHLGRSCSWHGVKVARRR